jgi:hypothetical protein
MLKHLGSTIALIIGVLAFMAGVGIHSGDVFYAFSDQAEPLRAHTSERISEKVNAPTRNAASIADLFVKASALALIVFEKYPEACLIFGAIIIVAFVWYRRPKQGERW